jgi:hypothetical protein
VLTELPELTVRYITNEEVAEMRAAQEDADKLGRNWGLDDSLSDETTEDDDVVELA